MRVHVCASMCVNTQKPKTLACTLIFTVICFAVVHVMHMWHSSDVLPMLNGLVVYIHI